MLDSVLDSYSTKKLQGIKEIGKYKPLKGKKKSTETVPGNDLFMAVTLDKDFKTMCEQNGNINRD